MPFVNTRSGLFCNIFSMVKLYVIFCSKWPYNEIWMHLDCVALDLRFYASQEISSSGWRHQMETFSAWLAICAGNSPVTGVFPSQKPVTRSFGSLICAWINGWVNNRAAGNLRRHRAHYDVSVMVRMLWKYDTSVCNAMIIFHKHHVILQWSTHIRCIACWLFHINRHFTSVFNETC